MTRFMDKSFSTYAPADSKYQDNWEATFGKRGTEEASQEDPQTKPYPFGDKAACALLAAKQNAPDPKVEALVKALRHIQYGSCDGCGSFRMCPECGAGNPHEDGPQDQHGPDCPVGLALAPFRDR